MANSPDPIFDITSPVWTPANSGVVQPYRPPAQLSSVVVRQERNAIDPARVADGAKHLTRTVIYLCVIVVCIPVAWKLVEWVISW